MRKAFIGMTAAIACGFLICGCGEKAEKAAGGAVPAAKAQDPKAMAAIVNGEVITNGDVDEEVTHMTAALKLMVPPEKLEAMKPRMRSQSLENLVGRTLLLQEAKKQGIKPDEKAVQEKIVELKKTYPSPEQFDKQCADFGVSKERLHKEVAQNLILKTLLEKETGGAGKVTKEEIEEFYRSKPESFKMPERIKASHILITSDASDDAAAKKAKREKIEAIREQLKKGADFEALAREHSECPSKAQGGDLGYITKGQMVKPFEEAAFALKKDEVSDVVETMYGYHLIKVTDRKEAKVVPLEEAKEKIEAFLTQQKSGKAVGDYMDKLRKAAKIKYAGKDAS